MRFRSYRNVGLSWHTQVYPLLPLPIGRGLLTRLSLFTSESFRVTHHGRKGKTSTHSTIARIQPREREKRKRKVLEESGSKEAMELRRGRRKGRR
ncbi:hypothetical protein K470DRAFT_124290 [Piedraia hortae CBS 480.64]|uniref:Uncharacterized protein n=1 Tax=Piedraia hortae CBS 480.64 TaxID=1314780 RepID=A0A6A7C796_9PEZI|nr:hypothetical protein K470DRAFT_124290 [Piedraia hortae CBS 480.64]